MGKNPFLNKLRFSPAKSMMLVFGVYILITSPMLLPIHKYGRNVAEWPLVVFLVTTILACVSVNSIIIMAHKVESRTSWARRWELKAKWILSRHISENADLDELLKGLELSIHDYATRLKIFTGAGSLLVAFVSLERTILGQEQSLSRNLLNYLGIEPAYHLLIILALFGSASLAIFIFIFVPLSWRQQLKPFLEREVEHYKAKMAPPATNQNRLQKLWRRFSGAMD